MPASRTATIPTPNADNAVQVTEYVTHHGFEATVGARDMPTRASKNQKARHHPKHRAMGAAGGEDEVAEDHKRLCQEDAKSDANMREPEGSPRQLVRRPLQVCCPADPACSSSRQTLPFKSLFLTSALSSRRFKAVPVGFD